MDFETDDYYSNLVTAIKELSSTISGSDLSLSDEEADKWVTNVILNLSEKYNVLKIDLDEMHQYM